MSHRVAEPVFKSLPSLHVCQKFLRLSQILAARSNTQQSDALLPRIFHAEFPAHLQKDLDCMQGPVDSQDPHPLVSSGQGPSAVLFLHVQSVTLLDWTGFVRIRFSKNVSENRIGSERCLHQCNHDRPQVAGEKKRNGDRSIAVLLPRRVDRWVLNAPVPRSCRSCRVLESVRCCLAVSSRPLGIPLVSLVLDK